MTRILQTLLLAALLPTLAQGADPRSADAPALFQVGTMHQAIGRGHSKARVAIADVIAEPHVYALGALAGLAGEITILNSEPILTGVSATGRPVPHVQAAPQATLLVGQTVAAWDAVDLHASVEPDDFDATIAAALRAARLDPERPVLFLIEGEFTDVRLHVLNGACPVHARMKGIELPAERRPFELESATIRGTLLGIHAADAVGELTHPATSTHVHLVYVERESGALVTAHLERVGVAQGAVLKLPLSAASETSLRD